MRAHERERGRNASAKLEVVGVLSICFEMVGWALAALLGTGWIGTLFSPILGAAGQFVAVAAISCEVYDCLALRQRIRRER